MKSGMKNKDARKRLRHRMVFTLEEVAESIGRTIHTARRRLKTWGACRSYNKNGRYYTLPEVPEFDADGMWRWKEIFFSRYGSLSKTLVTLICRAEAGLDAAEIQAILKLDPRSFLSGFADHPQLHREKTGDRFVYYSAEIGVRSQQLQRRRRQITSARKLTDAEAIAILVEKIKHPDLSDKALSRRLSAQNLRVEPEMIGNFFTRHGLSVKKTPHLP